MPERISSRSGIERDGMASWMTVPTCQARASAAVSSTALRRPQNMHASVVWVTVWVVLSVSIATPSFVSTNSTLPTNYLQREWY